MKTVQKQAFRFLRAAKKTTGTFDRRVKINSDFMKGADLKPVLDFLSEK